MQSKNKPSMTADEREYVRLVKLLPCSVCECGGGEAAPSEAHEIKQGCWWLSVALCASCHRGALLGWHGQRRMWAIKKMDESDALAVTIARLFKQFGLRGTSCSSPTNPISRKRTLLPALPAT